MSWPFFLSSKRCSIAVLLTLAALITASLAPTTALAQSPSTEQKISEDKAGEYKVAESKAPARGSNLVSKIWWNQPKKVEELQLSDGQRHAMDAALLVFLRERENGQSTQKERLNTFGEALGRDDMDTARAQGEKFAEGVATPVHLQIEMMIKVVGLMTPEQRKKMVASYPRMFSRLWVQSARARHLMAGGGQRKGRQ
jgi:Spy/CpxP family protein refolding chaperone